MALRSRAIVLRPHDAPSRRVVMAERKLATLIGELDALDTAVEVLSRELSDFEECYRHATSEAFDELADAERLARDVRRLRDEIKLIGERLRQGPPEGRRTARLARDAAQFHRAVASAALHDEEDGASLAPDEEAVEVIEAGALDLKALYRRLARVLHPDLAQGGDLDRARLSDLMSRVNDAYARGDRAALELLAERVGAGESFAPSEAERRRYLGRRIKAVEVALERLRGEERRLATSTAARLREEAQLRAAAGGDLFIEARMAAQERAQLLREQALGELVSLTQEARALARARREKGIIDGRRAWDPLEESPFVRSDRRRRGERRQRPAVRALSAWVEQVATEAPWKVGLTLLGFFDEEAGHPLDAVTDWISFTNRWEALRGVWPGAPDFSRALARAPRHLVLALRARGDQLYPGLLLRSPALAEGIRASLESAPVAVLARTMLAVMGPRQTCPSCEAEVYAVHLQQLHGLDDDMHALACPLCATVLHKYWCFGAPQGLEALGPLALRVGLISEQEVHLGAGKLGLQMLPEERAHLTARALLRRFRALCLEPNDIALPRQALSVRVGREVIASGARVPDQARVSLVVDGGALDAPALWALLRERVARRFQS